MISSPCPITSSDGAGHCKRWVNRCSARTSCKCKRGIDETRPGDTIQPTGIVKSKQVTKSSRWVLIDVMVRNQAGDKVATGEAMVEFPSD